MCFLLYYGNLKSFRREIFKLSYNVSHKLFPRMLQKDERNKTENINKYIPLCILKIKYKIYIFQIDIFKIYQMFNALNIFFLIQKTISSA